MRGVPQGSVLGLVLFNILVTSMMGVSALSASLQLHQPEWCSWCFRREGWHPEGLWQTQKVGVCEPHWSSTQKSTSLVLLCPNKAKMVIKRCSTYVQYTRQCTSLSLCKKNLYYPKILPTSDKVDITVIFTVLPILLIAYMWQTAII